MALQKNQSGPIIGFQSITLLKTQILGIGSYGKVCKAKCDDLLCAAKIIHETLFDQTAQQQLTSQRDHRLPFRRFQQECQFMSAIKHPNIVQFLGTHQDPETGLPVLLMELMDDSLTHFLENSKVPVSYHIQVNFCHDITLAISYLHSNGIIHRDLSSNNVLLRGNVITKVTDFGMAVLGKPNPQATHISLTMVPGTDAYMPLEAVKDQPVYTEKIDCFAIGTLIIQILTREFPKPGNRHKIVQTTDPHFPTIEVRVSEIERRQNHISLVDFYHPLLPIALHCLSDSDADRPSAQGLCRSLESLKKTPQYAESVLRAQDKRQEQESISDLEQQMKYKDHIIKEKDDVIQSLRLEYTRHTQDSRQIIGLKDDFIQGKEQINTTISKQDECQKLRETIREKDRELQRLTQKLNDSQQVTAQFQTRIQELEQQKSSTVALAKQSLSVPLQIHQSGTATRNRLKLTWKKGENAPYKMFRGSGDATVDGDMVYFKPGGASKRIYSYNSRDGEWSQLPDCQTEWCSLAVVNNFLTTVGGRSDGYNKATNQLFSLTEEGSNKRWLKVFPPMPTKRSFSTAVCSRHALIVAGGEDQNFKTLRTVEVMDTATHKWSTAADLPAPLPGASATINDDRIYMLGGWNDIRVPTNSVYTCLLSDLLLSSQSRSPGDHSVMSLSLTGHTKFTVWNKIADLPVKGSTCVALRGQLLAIGGLNSDYKSVSDIRIYNPTFNQWEIVSEMTVARRLCFAAVLPNYQLLVVGGRIGLTLDSVTDSIEIATIV